MVGNYTVSSSIESTSSYEYHESDGGGDDTRAPTATENPGNDV